MKYCNENVVLFFAGNLKMASLIIAGILCLIAFYFVIFVTGIAASMYIKVSGYGSKMDSNAEFSKFEQAAVAGRQIHGIVGCMTMIGG